MFQCPLVARTPRGHGGQAAPRGDTATQGCPHAAHTHPPTPRVGTPSTPRRLPVLSAGRLSSAPYGNPAWASPPSPWSHTGSGGQPASHTGSRALGRTPRGDGATHAVGYEPRGRLPREEARPVGMVCGGCLPPAPFLDRVRSVRSLAVR